LQDAHEPTHRFSLLTKGQGGLSRLVAQGDIVGLLVDLLAQAFQPIDLP
jgi:hypothetical protein